MRLLYDSGLQSIYRESEFHYNLLHFLTFPALKHHRASTVLAIARLICERQPEFVTEIPTNGFSPIELLADRQRASDWRDSASEQVSERTLLTRELSTIMSRKEAKYRRESRRR